MDEEKTFAGYLEKAKKGDTKAEIKVGHLYMEGRLVERDYKSAAHWYSRAALKEELEAKAGVMSALLHMNRLEDLLKYYNLIKNKLDAPKRKITGGLEGLLTKEEINRIFQATHSDSN